MFTDKRFPGIWDTVLNKMQCLFPRVVILMGGWGGRQTVNKADKTSKTNRALTVRRVLIRGLLAHSKPNDNPVGISSVQSLSHIRLFATQWTAADQASLFITNSWSLLKLMSIESVMPSNHLILCRPLLLPPSIFPSIRVFSS